MKYPKVKEVTPLQNMTLSVLFDNGITKNYDVRQLYNNFPDFELLERNYIFDQVKVDAGGYDVYWNSDLDISECELWINGVAVE
jgi:hypothetical protein